MADILKLAGKNGSVVIDLNGEIKQIATLTKFEYKATGQFDKDYYVGSANPYSTFNGFEGTGTVSTNKANSDLVSFVNNCFTTGIFPQVTIYVTITNPVTLKSERWEITGVQFTEFTINTEANKGISEDFPFSATNQKLLDTL